MEHHVFEYLKMITDQYLGKDQTTTRSLQNGQDLGFELNTFRNVVGGVNMHCLYLTIQHIL